MRVHHSVQVRGRLGALLLCLVTGAPGCGGDDARGLSPGADGGPHAGSGGKDGTGGRSGGSGAKGGAASGSGGDSVDAGDGGATGSGGAAPDASTGGVTADSGVDPLPDGVRLVTGASTVDIDDLFDLMSAIFAPDARGPDLFTLEATALPAADVKVTLTAPAALAAKPGVLVFARVYEGSEDDGYDRFVPLPSSKEGAEVTAAVPVEAFRAVGSGFAAELILASTPVVPRLTSNAVPAGCPDGLAPLGPPLDTIAVIRRMNMQTTTTLGGKTVSGHPGSDLKAADGVTAKAVGNGTVVAARESNGKTLYEDNRGAGGTIVIDVPGTGHVQYMHLKKGSITVKVGDKVTLGQKIAETDSTGYSQASHLHLELKPEDRNERIDPLDCIDPDLKPEIYAGTMTLDMNQEGMKQTATATVTLSLDGEDEKSKIFRMAGKVTVSPIDFGGLICLPAITEMALSPTTPPLGWVVINKATNKYGVALAASWSTSIKCPDAPPAPGAVAMAFFTIPQGCGAPGTPDALVDAVSQFEVKSTEGFIDTYVQNYCNVGTMTGAWNFTRQ